MKDVVTFRSRMPLAAMTVEMLLDRTKQLRDEKAIVDEVLTPMRLTAKTCVKQDRAMFTVNLSQRIVAESMDGLTTQLRRAIRPLKKRCLA